MSKRPFYTEQEYQEEKRLVLDLLSQLSDFGDTTEEAAERRRKEASKDIWKFAEYYVQHYFPCKEQAEFHQDWFKMACAIELLTVLAAPRGFSKSTFFSFLLILWHICYGTKRFIVLMMETFDKSQMQTWRVLLELQNNGRLIADFGRMVSDEAGRSDFTTYRNDGKPGTRLLAMGTGMSMRGLIYAQYRPDMFIGDDLESRALARNPKRVEQLLELILSDYFLAMCAEDYTFLIVGTIICRGSALDRLRKIALGEDPEYETSTDKIVFKKYRAIEYDQNGVQRSTWEALHPLVKLLALLEIIGPTRFAAEKQNEPRENKGIFKEKDIRYYDTFPEMMKRTDIIVSCDPSFSEIGDCKAGFVMLRYEHSPGAPDWLRWADAAGKTFDGRRYFIVLDVFNRQDSVDELIAKFYKWHEKYKPQQFWVEGNFNQRFFFERELANYIKEKKNAPTLPVHYVNNKVKKDDRIAELEPYFKRGEILFPARKTKDIETTVTQLIFYDGGKLIKDDGPDALAQGITKLIKGEFKRKTRT